MHKTFIKVKNNQNLVRDTRTGVILNIDHSEIAHYKKMKALDNRLNTLEQKFDYIIKLLESKE